EANEGNFTVCVDEGFSGFNTAKEGQALFDDKGDQSPILKQAVDFLEDYQKNVVITTAFCNNLKSLDVLEPMQANVELNSGDKFAIGGFLCINRSKLKALPEDKVAGLLKSDQMELIFAHLLSLNNVSKLIQKLS
ncbi:MAG: multidrug transporter, partial [Gammaproteobacteria bacterium]|nr:multidrug transporter [Gammaproteobacteria bacterium]